MKTPHLSPTQRQVLSHIAPEDRSLIIIDASRIKSADQFVLAKATKTPPNHGVSGKPAYQLWHKA